MTDFAIHSSNQVLLDGAVFDGPYRGLLRRRTAAEWQKFYDHIPRASDAIRRARDGVEGAYFKSLDGVTWHLRRVTEAIAE